MAIKSMFWAAPTTGHGTSEYTEAETARVFRAITTSDPTTEGVLPGYENGFEVTGSTSPLNCNTGGAFGYGFFAWDEATSNITVSTPVVGTTGKRIVLKADWTAKTVTIEVITSADGVATYPTLTQSAGSVWEIPLYALTITTGGVISLTDERTFIHFNTMIALSQIEFGSGLTPSYLADRTRHIFITAVGSVDYTNPDVSYVRGARVYNGLGAVMPDTEHIYSANSFYVPDDFVSGLTVDAIIIANNTGNLYCAAYADYGGLNQSLFTHTTSSPYSVISIGSASVLLNIKTLTLSSAAIGDFVSLRFARDASHASDTIAQSVYLYGWLATYTADS